MPVATSYTLSQFVVDRTSDLVVRGITDAAIDPGLAEHLLFGDGVVDPTLLTVGEIRPAIEFTTTSLALLLAENTNAFFLAGLPLSATAIGKFWLQKMAEGAARAGGSTNVMLAINEGLLIPTGFTARGNAPATINCRAVATYDGSNLPIAITDNAALLGSGGAQAAHVAGPVMFNGAALDGVLGIRAMCNIELGVRVGDGEVYPTYVCIQRRRPRFVIEIADAGVIADLGLTGTAQTATDSIIYLKKMLANGTRVANNVAEHISFTIDDGLAWVENIRAADGDFAGPSIVIQPVYDGTNAIVVVNPAVVIA